MSPSPETEQARSDFQARGSVLRRLLALQGYFGTLPVIWLLVVLSTVIGAATEPLIPAMLKPLLDRGFQQGTLAIWTVPATLLLLFGIRGLSGYVAQIGLTRITNQGISTLRSQMFDKLLRAHPDLFATQNSSALSNTVVYEVQNGAVMLTNSLLSLTRNALTLAALTAYLLYLNWKLSLIVVALFPALVAVMRTLTRRLHRLTKANQDATDALAYVVEENVLAFRDVRLYGAQTAQSRRFHALSEALRHLAMKSTVAGAATTPMTQMLAAVALSAVVSVALVQSAGGGTSVGSFVAFVTAMLMIIAPIRQLSEVSSPITRGLAALERGLDLLEGTADETQGQHAKARACGDLRFDAVCVRYGSALAVDQLCLTVRSGETVALVGASGSGKSTLINLLPRFIDASAGRVLLDGEDLRDWSLPALRAQFALVSQHVVMLNDTICNNVALGLPLDRARVQQCLQAAQLGPWLAALPEGMNTLVGHNATQLSGGQRQRLAIARALYKDAPVLILDEATSALDTESERAVQDALQVLMRGRTTLVVAHRLSTVQHADRIVVLEAGRVVEEGTHLSLLAQGGHYARLYALGLDSTAMA